MSRLLILGARGMLGHTLCHVLSHRGHEVVGTVRQDPAEVERFGEVFGRCRLLGPIDVLDNAALEQAVREIEPEAIVNAVGVVKQLKEAHSPLLSVGINAYLPHKLARLAEDHHSRLVHISTDCVFSGRKGHYTEDDPSDAEDLYGRSKALGETVEAEPRAVTLRTSFIGRELHRPTHGLLEWFLAQQGGQVRGFTRAIYTGLTSRALCDVIEHVIEKHPGLAGTWQVASEPINKFDLLMKIRDAMGLDVQIDPDEEFACDRSLSGERFARATGWAVPDWDAMVAGLAEETLPYETWFGDEA